MVLNNYKTLCNVVADKPDFHHKINTVFGIFSKICPLLFLKSKHLTSDEIASIKQLCNEFGEVCPVFFPNCNVTRKSHELIFTVPRFVSEFRTMEMISEEKGEVYTPLLIVNCISFFQCLSQPKRYPLL